ncbi:MAG TPA: DUF1501 domain-containing protein [Planctomycetaceae bacterium]|nr:hypothetical protein [Blastopirellula sp.]HAY78812.1 DUF1501 domain-containing protein [Planctomycetaceae bacterium]
MKAQHQISRRSVLQAGGGALGGLGLSRLLEAQEKSTAKQHVDHPAVIFVWLPGGPPHMEMYDLKPDAPEDYRGIYKPIETTVPGMEICELFPRQAKVADKFNIIRSVHHKFADHGGGHKRFLTGRVPATPTGTINDAPCVGSIATKKLQHYANPQGLCNYIVLGNGRVNSVDTFAFGSAYLGTETHPFNVSGDPNSETFKVQNLSLNAGLFEERLNDRVALLGGLDSLRKDVEASGVLDSMDTFNQRAISMVTSTAAHEAFDLSHESDALRDRYGRHEWGQRAILARRLVEAGVPWVTIVMENPYVSGISMPDWGVYNWDSHAVNCHLFRDSEVRFPIYDQVVSAMIEDLYNRGLDKRVMLVVTGEFGRTPRITERPGSRTKVLQPGRDHWPNSMSFIVAGGGMRTGQVIGATNTRGEEPVSRPLSPNDLWASVYKHLGINYDDSFPDFSGRPMPILPFGDSIDELDPVA